MLNKWTEKKGKKLRYGYTTGSCAAAVAKAAVISLITQDKTAEVSIETPYGWVLQLEVHGSDVNKDEASCYVIKDSGDDPDITNGIHIYGKAQWIDAGIKIKAGQGIGVVTKKGLSVPIGEPAINPVPMEMIKKEVRAVLPKDKGVVITLWVPEGEAIAKKTFNPRLGIQGGISIIGTTGIVEPMSQEALKDSLRLEMKILKEQGCKAIIFTPGNYGVNYLKDQKVCLDSMVKISNFVGDCLDDAVALAFEKILIVGHCGKLTKLAAGVFQTHSQYGDGRLETIAAYGALAGISKDEIERILCANTTDEAIEILGKNRFFVFEKIAERAKHNCQLRTQGKINIEVIIFSNVYGFLGQSRGGANLLATFTHEKN